MGPSTKRLIGAVALLVIVAFAFGYWLAPEKVKIETKVVTVEKKVIEYVKDKTSHKKTVIVVTKKPDGTSTTTTTITDDTETKSGSTVTDNTNTSSDTTKEVTKSSSRLTISALAGAPVSYTGPITPAYGIHVTKEVLGPISVGVFGFNTGLVGASVGVSF